uniref:Uncharacterized protein n=1 Tax=Cucumis melo TaxID=3656 RepID=A0A9I9EG11_CUCME
MRYAREVYRRQVEEMCLPLHYVEMTFFNSVHALLLLFLSMQPDGIYKHLSYLFLNSQSNSVHLMIKCKVHGSGEIEQNYSSFVLKSLGVDSINKKGGCINSLYFICLSCIPGHNYNRALVAASIGSYGAYLADV